MTIKHLPIGDISIDGGTQARVEINAATVDEYAEALTEGEKLPPVIVFFDGVNTYLADGFHRYHGNRKIGATTIECDIRTGTLLDARLFAYGANRDHGLRRTVADKRRAVAGMLADCPDWSDRAIAKHVGVSHPFVAAVRNPDQKARQAETRTSSKPPKVETVSTPPAAEQPGEQPAEQAAAQPDGQAGGLAAEQAEQPEVETVSTPPVDPLAYRVAELEQMAAELLADNKAMSEVFDADEKAAALLVENKKLRFEISGLRERVNGLMAEKNEAIRLMKSWRKKAEKFEAAAKAGT